MANYPVTADWVDWWKANIYRPNDFWNPGSRPSAQVECDEFNVCSTDYSTTSVDEINSETSKAFVYNRMEFKIQGAKSKGPYNAYGVMSMIK